MNIKPDKTTEKLVIEEKSFDQFIVKVCDDKHSFLHISLNEEDFYNKLFEYFFDEKRLIRYAENNSTLKFNPTKENFAELYRILKIFLDRENEIPVPNDIDEKLLDVIIDNYTVVDDNGVKKIRLDKVGKIGEYIFSNLLFDYFKFECIIPKLNLVTDRNMNVYGIDTLFYDADTKLLLLGESKVSKDLSGGIALINKSLSTYQAQIDEEYLLILSRRWLKDKEGQFNIDFGSEIELSLTMKDFIERADIQTIGIPLFIAHGIDVDYENIISALSKISKISLYNINTIFIIISLPLLDKKRFVESFTEAIAKRSATYERIVKQS